jgi:hypothetical protein
MAGGYGVRIEETVAVQLNTYRVALTYWQAFQQGMYSRNMPLAPYWDFPNSQALLRIFFLGDGICDA